MPLAIAIQVAAGPGATAASRSITRFTPPSGGGAPNRRSQQPPLGRAPEPPAFGASGSGKAQDAETPPVTWNGGHSAAGGQRAVRCTEPRRGRAARLRAGRRLNRTCAEPPVVTPVRPAGCTGGAARSPGSPWERARMERRPCPHLLTRSLARCCAWRPRLSFSAGPEDVCGANWSRPGLACRACRAPVGRWGAQPGASRRGTPA